MHDAGVGSFCQMQGVTAPGVAVDANVLVGRSMTRFARDAEFRRRRIHLLRRDRLRPERRVEGGTAERRMAGDTDAVPGAGFGERGLSRWMHHRRAARNPAPLVDQPDRRELTECPPVSGRVPIDLLIVRSRGQHHLAFYAMGKEWGRRGDAGSLVPTPSPIGVVELRPQLTAPLLERHRAGVYADTVKAGRH